MLTDCLRTTARIGYLLRALQGRGMDDYKGDSVDARARRYREQAKAVRDLAAAATTADIREQLYSVAADYQLLAEYLENLPEPSP
jgi:hypothetical protein